MRLCIDTQLSLRLFLYIQMSNFDIDKLMLKSDTLDCTCCDKCSSWNCVNICQVSIDRDQQMMKVGLLWWPEGPVLSHCDAIFLAGIGWFGDFIVLLLEHAGWLGWWGGVLWLSHDWQVCQYHRYRIQYWHTAWIWQGKLNMPSALRQSAATEIAWPNAGCLSY